MNEIEARVGEKFDRQDEMCYWIYIKAFQELMLDNTDRNRTSPFAFTDNKFEFKGGRFVLPILLMQ
ncbi:MAG: hypothetical protein R2765_04000 [Ferruginibacter sp.]